MNGLVQVQAGPTQLGVLDRLRRAERDRAVEDVAVHDCVEITGRVSEINDLERDAKATDCRRRRRASSEFDPHLDRELRLGAEILAASTPLPSGPHQRPRGQASNDRLITDE